MLTDSPVSAIVPVTNLANARKFYEGTLGLKVKTDMTQVGHMLYECGQGTILTVYERPKSNAEHTLAGFMVSDMAQAMADLRAKGIKFEEYDFPGMKTVDGVAIIGNIKNAWFKDPDGNILAISEMT